MNYTVQALNKISEEDVERNDLLDEQFAVDGEYSCQEIYGTKYRLEIEIVVDECPLYISFFCGSVSGVALEHCEQNYKSIESDPKMLVVDLQSTISEDFKYIVNHSIYSDDMLKTKSFLERKKVQSIIEDRKMYIVVDEDTLISLSQEDIVYYAAIEDEYQLERLRL